MDAFSIIPQVLHKIQEDKATVMTVLPLWPTQVWFPTALHLLTVAPVLLPQHPLVLPQHPTLTHPRSQGMVLAVMPLSGNPSLVRAYSQTLPDFCLNPGEKA